MTGEGRTVGCIVAPLGSHVGRPVMLLDGPNYGPRGIITQTVLVPNGRCHHRFLVATDQDDPVWTSCAGIMLTTVR